VQNPTRNEQGVPDLATGALFTFVDAFVTDPAHNADLRDRYQRGVIMDGHVKQEVAAAVQKLLAPMRERRAALDGPAGDDRALAIIKDGVRRANATAEETLYLAKKAMSLDFGRRTLA